MVNRVHWGRTVALVGVGVAWAGWIAVTTAVVEGGPGCAQESAQREPASLGDDADEAQRGSVAPPGLQPRAAADADGPAPDALAGIWWRWEAGLTGDPVRFYYFHGNGQGLYRYGRVGASNTHSFDYVLDEDALVLTFRKTGEAHTLQYAIEHVEGRDWLVLDRDPREPAATRYFREQPGPIDPHQSQARGQDQAATGAELGPPPAGHLWIDLSRYATGGYGFGLYQFRPAGIDGRGVGWFHRGDFDDWSTEAFTYRIVPSPPRIELDMTVSGRHEVTAFTIVGEGDERSLQLDADPHDYWHSHGYDDAGPSFGLATEAGDAAVRDLPLGPAALAEL